MSSRQGHREAHAEESHQTLHESFRDSVCGMTVKSEGPHEVGREGIRIVSCNAPCVARFRTNPEG